MCGISRRNASPAPAPRYTIYTSSHSQKYSQPSMSELEYSSSVSLPASAYPLPISVTHSPSTSSTSLPSRARSSSPGYQAEYVSSRGAGYYQGIEHSSNGSYSPQATPALVYSSASSIRSSSSRRSSSIYSGRDSPRGSWYGDEQLTVRPVSRESRGSFCASPVEEGEWRVWKDRVEERAAVRKDRRGALNGTLTPVEYGY